MFKFIYLIKSKETQLYKIGIATNPYKRIKNLQTGNAEVLQIITTYKTLNYNTIEKALHNRFSYIRKEGEWFEFDLDIELNFLKYCELYDKNINLIKNNNVYI